MTSSREQYQERIGKNEPIPVRLRAYYKQRFQQKAFARLAKAFADCAEEFGLTKSGVASLVDRDKAQINRLLAHPSNMTFDTYSELALALNFEPTIILEDLSEEARHNYRHPAYDWFGADVDLSSQDFQRVETKSVSGANVVVLENM